MNISRYRHKTGYAYVAMAASHNDVSVVLYNIKIVIISKSSTIFSILSVTTNN